MSILETILYIILGLGTITLILFMFIPRKKKKGSDDEY